MEHSVAPVPDGLEASHLTPPFRIAVEADTLRAHPAETEIILRLGAIANALLSLGRATARADGSLASHRDLDHFATVAPAYLHEAADVLNRRHDGLAWRLAEKGIEAGRPLPGLSLPELKEIFNDDDFRRQLKTIRDTFAFHFDPKRFLDWLREACPDGPILMTVEGPQIKDVLFDASSLVLRRALGEVMTSTFNNQIQLAVAAFPYVVEAIVVGFLREKKLSVFVGTREAGGQAKGDV